MEAVANTGTRFASTDGVHMRKCHVGLSGTGSAGALLRSIHAHEATLLPLLAPDGQCEAVDVARVGGTFRVRARIRTRDASVMWIQAEGRDVFAAVSECFDEARQRLERRSRRPTTVKAPRELPVLVVRRAL